jgi:tetratricopeptide (TPR) repeat protein
VEEFNQKLLQIIDWVYKEEQNLRDKLTDKEYSETGTFNKWSAKDIIAHTSFWKLLRAKSIDAVLRGETPAEIGDFQKINEGVFREYINHSWDDIIDYSKKAYNSLKKIINTASSEDLNNEKTFPLQGNMPIWKIIVIYCCLHPLDHLDKYYTNRNQTYYAINLWKEAIDLLERLPASSGIIGNAKYNLSRFYALSGQKFIAIRTLNQAVQLNPKLIKRSTEDPDLSSIRDQLE